MAKNPETEALHQKAASYYLQGNFKSALQEWSRLLTLDPTDHRAIEGARLCEMLAEEGDSISIGVPSAPAAATDAPPAISLSGEGSDDLDDLDDLMDGSAVATPAVSQSAAPVEVANLVESTSHVPAAAPVSSPAADDGPVAWDLDSLAGAEATGAPVIHGGGLELDQPDASEGLELVADVDAVAVETADEAGATAEAELRTRVDQLLTEAQAAYDSGDRDLALGIISRTFILQEANPAALELKQRILDEIEQGVSATASSPDASVDSSEKFEELLGEVPEAKPTESMSVPEPPADQALAPAMDAPAQPEVEVPVLQLVPQDPESVPDLDEPGDPADDVEGTDLEEFESVEAVADRAAPVPAKSSGRLYWVTVAAIALVIVGAGGFAAWKFIGSRQAKNQAAIVPVELAVEDPAMIDDPAVVETNDPAAAPAPATPAEPVDVPALLAQARKAEADGDHAQAVLAYGAVLEVEPANAEAKLELQQAGTRYRKRLVVLEKHEEGIAAFNDGNYRTALSIFYRLPDAEDNPKVDRYKANGWHNLGLQAIKAGNCSRALGHFKEMRSVIRSRTVEGLIGLARTCRSADRDVAYAKAVLALEYRTIDD